MSLLMYAAKSEAAAKRLQQAVEEIVPAKDLEICPDFKSLSSRLQQPMNGLEIAVLLAGSERDLTGFHSLRDLLSEMRILLVIPDREPETYTRAHRLRPRFMTHTDSDFQDIKAVLGKMVDGPKPGRVRNSSRKNN